MGNAKSKAPLYWSHNTHMQVYVPRETLKVLRQIRKDFGLPVNKIVNFAINKYLEELYADYIPNGKAEANSSAN